MCVLYVIFGSKVRPRTFGCVTMRSAVLFIFLSRLLLYSEGSGVTRVQVVLSGFGVRLLCFVQAKTLCGYDWLHLVHVCVDVMVISSAWAMTCTGASGGGMSAMYVLNSVNKRTPPCGTPVLN